MFGLFLHHEGTKDTKISNEYSSEVRALRALRGEGPSQSSQLASRLSEKAAVF
jgi:hypothetical protein